MIVTPNQVPPQPLDLRAMLAGIAARWPTSEKIDVFSAKLGERPAQNTLIFLGLGALLFYIAERQANPRINSIYDALEYCSSSLSVGYTGIYPQTPVGKLVASALMTYGPALTGAMLDGPRNSERPPNVTEEKILVTLEAILAELRRESSRS